MNRRSFFGFFPAALAGAVVGVPAVKTAWGDGIPKILADWEREDFWRGVAVRSKYIAEQMRASREILDRSPSLQSHIDNHLRIDLKRLEKVQAELAIYPPHGVTAA